MRWLDRDPLGRALVEEWEAFLQGGYAELCERRREAVPRWAWLNLPSHGSETLLRTAVTAPPDAERWRRARAFVAGEVVGMVEVGRAELVTLQRRILVPFELRMMSPARGANGPEPLGRLVNELLDALSDKRAQLRA